MKTYQSEHRTLPTLDKILEPLKDGKWHHLKEINEAVGLPEDKMEEIMRFLAKYRLIQLDRNSNKARLTSSVLEFLKKTR